MNQPGTIVLDKLAQKRMLYWLEREVAKQSPYSEEAHKIADINLRQWARGYLFHNRREFESLTGNGGGSSLGRDVKRNNRDNNVHGYYPLEIDDARFRSLNSVMALLDVFNHHMLDLHYIEKGDTPINQHLLNISMTKHRYYKNLKAARQEFILLGGIVS